MRELLVPFTLSLSSLLATGNSVTRQLPLKATDETAFYPASDLLNQVVRITGVSALLNQIIRITGVSDLLNQVIRITGFRQVAYLTRLIGSPVGLN